MLTLAAYHTSILLYCLKIITANLKEDIDLDGDTTHNEGTLYACDSWRHHLHGAVSHGAAVDHLLLSQSKDLLVDAIGKLAGDMFGPWLATLRFGTAGDLKSTISQLEVSKVTGVLCDPNFQCLCLQSLGTGTYPRVLRNRIERFVCLHFFYLFLTNCCSQRCLIESRDEFSS